MNAQASGTNSSDRNRERYSKRGWLGNNEVLDNVTRIKKSIIPNQHMINIHTVTLNCGGQIPQSYEELLPCFEIKDQKSLESGFMPDIYIIGLQEIVTLNAKNCLIKDSKRIELWRSMLTQAIDVVTKNNMKQTSSKWNSEDLMSENQFVYTDKNMVGLYISCFIKRNLMARLKPKSL